MTETDRNKALVRELIQVWGESRFDRFAELVDPDGTWWTLAARRTRSIRDQLVRIQGLNAETVTGTIAFEVGTMTAEGDRVVAEVESHTDFALQGSYNNLYTFAFRVADGRVVEARAYYDTALANRVLRGEGTGTPGLESHRND